jgi:hypothetical protein
MSRVLAAARGQFMSMYRWVNASHVGPVVWIMDKGQSVSRSNGSPR